jgi:hypothetical protein
MAVSGLPWLHPYLARAGYTAGRLFRASINGSGGPLSYDAAHHRWEGHCSAAGVEMEIHQLRHALYQFVHRGRPPAPRPRQHRDHPADSARELLDDKVADAEIRAARRR